jgi:tetraacyldisaccharide 4'-kinase
MRYPDFWQRRAIRSLFLSPLAALVCWIAKRRRSRAAKGAGVVNIDRPVFVIGNLTVGGTGKTPILIALARILTEHGYAVGIISRGYGVRIGVEPRDVAEATGASDVGDEPWLIYQKLALPVMVHPDRVRAAQQLRARYPEVDLILSDDGLQHHRLGRAFQMAVIDGTRRFGNGFCVPAGPLREPLSARAAMDFIVVNGTPFEPGQLSARFEMTTVHDLYDEQTQSLDEFISLHQGQTIQALAGIGNPSRFFDALRDRGLVIKRYPLDDHQPIPRGLLVHLRRSGLPVLMTEKDAVKWRQNQPLWHNQPGQIFAVSGRMILDEALIDAVLTRLAAYRTGYPPAMGK